MDKDSINFVTRDVDFPNSDETLVMKITDKEVWVNPELEVNDAAAKVIDILQDHILGLVREAVQKEREECAELCEGMSEMYARLWNGGLRKDKYLEGMSDAADDCKDAIRGRK